jgi:membrane protease subunit HflC
MNRNILLIVGIVVAALLFVGWQSAFTVHQREQALVLRFGQVTRAPITEAGLHFKVPFIENVVRFDKRILGFEAQAQEIIAADQRRLVVDTFARFRIVDSLKFYTTVNSIAGLRARLSSLMDSSVRGVLGSQESLAIISGERAATMTAIRDSVNREAQQFGIEIVDVRIKRADFPEAISQAIYRRMQTERQREAAESRAEGNELAERIRADADRQRTITLADARRQSEILRGDGDATRTKVLAEAANRDPEFFAFYRSLQAYSQALQNSDTTMVLSPDSEFFRYFADPPGLGQPRMLGR